MTEQKEVKKKFKKQKMFGHDVTVEDDQEHSQGTSMLQNPKKKTSRTRRKTTRETSRQMSVEEKDDPPPKVEKPEKPVAKKGKKGLNKYEQNLVTFIDWVLGLGVPGLRNLWNTELCNFLPPGTCSAWEANKDKNRYADIACFDETRVKLTLNVPPCTDYIHANTCKFDYSDRVFIATQGPLENTCEDFWRMVFQEQAQRIINLTKIEEDGREKCFQYFPNQPLAYLTFGKMFVQTKKVEKLEKFLMYTIEILPEGCSNSAIVKLIHMDSWPEKGNPSGTMDILKAIKYISTEDVLATGPMVVHCSAGVGRTGTLILIHVFLCRLYKSGASNDLTLCFKQLRSQRASSIQRDGQFLIVVLSIMEYISAKHPVMRAKCQKFKEDYMKATDMAF